MPWLEMVEMQVGPEADGRGGRHGQRRWVSISEVRSALGAAGA